MACEFLGGDSVVFSVWGKPSKRDVDTAIHYLQTAQELSGLLAVYITRVPVNAPAPDADVRQYLNSVMPKITALCSSYHVVLEGAGFVAALKRGVLVSLFQIGNRRGTFFVHSSVDDVPRNVEPERQLAVRSLLMRADARGLLRGRIPASVVPISRPKGLELRTNAGVHVIQEQPSRAAGANSR